MGEDCRPLIPRFSVRSLLLAMAAAAGVAFLLSQAARGSLWAAAVSIGLAFVALALSCYALLFAISCCIPRIRRKPSRSSTEAASERTAHAAAKTVLLAISLALNVGTHPALALSGGSMTLPTAGDSATGLQLTVDTRWIDSSGYGPVRIKLVSP